MVGSRGQELGCGKKFKKKMVEIFFPKFLGDNLLELLRGLRQKDRGARVVPEYVWAGSKKFSLRGEISVSKFLIFSRENFFFQKFFFFWGFKINFFCLTLLIGCDDHFWEIKFFEKKWSHFYKGKFFRKNFFFSFS